LLYADAMKVFINMKTLGKKKKHEIVSYHQQWPRQWHTSHNFLTFDENQLTWLSDAKSQKIDTEPQIHRSIVWLLSSCCDWLDPHCPGSRLLSHQKRIRNHPRHKMKQIKICKTVGKHWHVASSTENAGENTSRYGLARWTKIFRVGQKFLMQSLKILFRIKTFGGTIFFLTGPCQVTKEHNRPCIILCGQIKRKSKDTIQMYPWKEGYN